MLKIYINESNEFLNEDIDAVKKYYPNIDDDTFMQLIQLDPTYRGNQSLGKYGKWILNLYNKGNLSTNDMNNITNVLNQFTTYRNRIQNKDLNSYKSLADLEDILATVVDDDSMLTDRQKLRFLKNVKAGRTKISAEDDYNIVLETPKFIVYVPNTHEASMKLGQGTSWCTAHENPNWYNHYTEDGGKLYIVKDKKTGERWQYSDSSGDFLDDTDTEFNVLALLAQDKQLADFFSQFGFEGTEHFNENGYYVYDGTAIPDDMEKYILKVLIKDGITYIPERAFDGCTSLQIVEISNTVKTIGSKAFRGCNSLRYIDIPESVENIENGAFSYCEFLTTVKLSEGLQNISEDTFAGCERLSTIVIPNSVKRIGSDAFYGCESLKSVIIPEGVQEIDDFAFSGCESLTSIIIPNSVTAIGYSVFERCENLKSVVLPNTITEINDYMFESCTSLESVKIPNTVTCINTSAFSSCYALKSITIPEGVETIGMSTFYDCAKLKSIIVPNSVTKIGEGAFDWHSTVYTNSAYVKDYCKQNKISVKPLNANESLYKHKPFRLKLK